jgi:hypothetical protein
MSLKSKLGGFKTPARVQTLDRPYSDTCKLLLIKLLLTPVLMIAVSWAARR